MTEFTMARKVILRHTVFFLKVVITSNCQTSYAKTNQNTKRRVDVPETVEGPYIRTVSSSFQTPQVIALFANPPDLSLDHCPLGCLLLAFTTRGRVGVLFRATNQPILFPLTICIFQMLLNFS